MTAKAATPTESRQWYNILSDSANIAGVFPLYLAETKYSRYMERKISFADVQKAVDEAYEEVKNLNEGSVDPRVSSTSKAGTFGISLVLTDGRSVDKGDADTHFALGPIAKIPVSAVLLSQNSPDELAQKAGKCMCGCHKDKKVKTEMPFGRHGLKAVSAIVPQGDPESKYNLITGMIAAMSQGDNQFNDELYKYYTAQAQADNVASQLGEGGFRIYDDAAQTIDTYSRVLSIELNSKQLATLGATVAADGRNPYTGEYAFDGSIAAPMVALMASRGKHFLKRWLVLTGLPAKKSFTGGIVAVLPGFGAIAAYSPEVDDRGLSVKAAKAIYLIAKKLGLNVFASARVSVE